MVSNGIFTFYFTRNSKTHPCYRFSDSILFQNQWKKSNRFSNSLGTIWILYCKNFSLSIVRVRYECNAHSFALKYVPSQLIRI